MTTVNTKSGYFGSDTERILLNMDVRAKLRLGSNFNTRFEHGFWWVTSVAKKPREWRAIMGKGRFLFIETEQK